jgi:hypothetical protein
VGSSIACVGLAWSLVAASAAASPLSRHGGGPKASVLHANGDTLVWRATRNASRYVLSATTRSGDGQHVVQSHRRGVVRTRLHVSAPAGDSVIYRVRAQQRGSRWTNPVTIHFPAPTKSATGAPSSVALNGQTIVWSAGNGEQGAVSTAPRGATGRQTTYVQLPAGTSWSPAAQPGSTLYYGVKIDGQWSSNEVEISWPAGSRGTGSSTGTGSATGTGSSGSSTGSGTSPTGSGSTAGGGSAMAVGVDEQGWGTPGASDIASTFGFDRMDVEGNESASDFTSRGVRVDMLFSGPYSSGGVSSINASTWAQQALHTFQTQCGGSTANCPSVEVLNEPYGSWFWGPNADSATNEAAYAHLLVTTSTLFRAQYGAAGPKILAAFGSDSWWAGITAAVPNIDNYIDGVTVHCYGGTGSASVSALGDPGLVVDAHQTTGEPIWVSEFGWPTALGQPATSDSLQWSFTQQADNTYNFVNWLRSTGYVAAAIEFNYRDYGTNMWYGLETSSGVKKPAWTALAEAAGQQPCTVCG